MSHYYGIGDAAKKLHQKLADSLAGPFQAYLPREWIAETLTSIGYKFRCTAFSPSDHSLGIHRPSTRPRLLVQPRTVPYSSPPRGYRTRSPVNRYRSLLQGPQTPSDNTAVQTHRTPRPEAVEQDRWPGVVAWPTRQSGRRVVSLDARHAGQPASVSTTGQPEARGRFSSSVVCGGFLSGYRSDVGFGVRPVA